MMSQHTHRSTISQPRHQAPARRRRRLGTTAGALLTGTALVLGTATMADAKTTTPIGSGPLYDNCKVGFTGYVTIGKGKVTVKFDPSAAYVGGAAEIDVRTTKTVDGRARTVRLKFPYEPLADGSRSKSWNLDSKQYVWRVGVTATTAADPDNDVHALDHEAGPCE